MVRSPVFHRVSYLNAWDLQEPCPTLILRPNSTRRCGLCSQRLLPFVVFRWLLGGGEGVGR